MKKNRTLTSMIVFALIAAIVISIGAHCTRNAATQMANTTASQISELYLRELSSATSKHMQTVIDYRFAHLDSVARLLTKEVANDEALLLKYITAMKETHQFSFLAFVDEDGYYHDGTGVYPAASKVSFLGSLMQGATHLISYNEKIQNNDVILLGASLVPIRTDDTRFVAVLAGLDTQTMMQTLVLANEQSHTYSSIVTEDGTYVIFAEVNERFRGTNLLTTLKKTANFPTEGDFERLIEGLKDENSGTLYFTTKAGEAFYLYYARLPNTDWNIVTLMPYEVIESTILELGESINNSSMLIFFIFAMLLLALFILYIRFSVRKQRQLEQAHEAAEQALGIAEEANRAKSVFLSNMSHDIRTPMNAIVGFVTLLSRDADNPEKVREYAKKITHSSQHLLGLINDVLDMAKIESGKTTLNVTETSLADVVEDVNTIIRPQMKEKGHQFDIQIHNVRHEMVKVDKLRIHQILLNLLTNAAKYTPAGGHIVLEVSEVKQTSQQFAKYRFTVTDNGIGIAPEYLNSIFDVFSRGQNSVVNKIQGTGLGLAITKNLVNLMGGSISVQSEKGEGSVFTVDLNLKIVEAAEDVEFWSQHHIFHMLVVDDEEAVCKSVAWTMEQVGVSVDTALEGRRAVEKVAAAQESDNPYQTILLDWKMPGKDGIEVAKDIRKIVPANVPIMILTSYDYSEIEGELAEGVVDGFIPKPFFEGSFRSKLQEILSIDKMPEGSEEAEGCLKGKHVLVAEDNELNAEILTELLEMEGATCEVYENGKLAYEAFERSQADHYQLVLMDVQMLVMNGYEATRMIRKCSHPRATTIPIIAMTADAFAEDIQKAMDAGMSAHLSKPIDMNRLRKTVHDLL